LKFEREDWTDFRTVEGLQRKAGVSKDKLSRLVLKELADNALDSGADKVGVHGSDGAYVITDNGPGIDETPKGIARLFSINRPMVSTKRLRLPTRGALGNGLRVVAGAVLASEGSLTVTTRNRRIVLHPEQDGGTTVVSVEPVKCVGTKVEITFGPELERNQDTTLWAKIACMFAGRGKGYGGRSSPWWYDLVAFHELLLASGVRPVRDLVAHLDGCTGGRAGEIVDAAGLSRSTCRDVTKEQAATLLETAQRYSKLVTAQRLGAVGPDLIHGYAYACVRGLTNTIPFSVEAWAKPNYEMNLFACVNRTPVTGSIRATRDGRDINVFGCGLHHEMAKAPKGAQFIIWLNITTPYMPIISDGKAPNLKPFYDEIADAIVKVVRKAHRPNAGGEVTQKDVVLSNLDDVIADVSGDGEFRFNSRQLFYGLRPIVMKETGEELKLGNFTGIITDYEADNGEIPGMYREPRGSITHPHRDETITLGTLMVEEYERPAWTFNKLV
jgi:hypothetical protein